MTRIILDRATIELLHNLAEPLEFCDEAGCLMGRFVPEAAELAGATVSVAALHRHEVAEGLGGEMSLFGFEADLE